VLVESSEKALLPRKNFFCPEIESQSAKMQLFLFPSDDDLIKVEVTQ